MTRICDGSECKVLFNDVKIEYAKSRLTQRATNELKELTKLTDAVGDLFTSIADALGAIGDAVRAAGEVVGSVASGLFAAIASVFDDEKPESKKKTKEKNSYEDS